MKKVIIGMSGGVDSSVAAYVLKNQGYEVIGVTLSLYRENAVTGATDDCRDAAAVCEKLGIKHIVVDKRSVFENTVIKNFIDEYERGGTPNPCVLCNKAVKFSEMLKIAHELGASFVATGHYCDLINDNGKYMLKRPKDKNKDQTYMLYKLTQNELSRILMPLSSYTKEEIREIARKIGLAVADRPDSQDICFVPDGDYVGFISRYTGKTYPQGDYISVDSKILGRHKGIINYTVGQRKGLGIALGKPAFVISKNAENNTVTLSDDEALLFTDTVKIKDINFISGELPKESIRVEAKLRYRHKESPATLSITGENQGVLVFETPQRAAASGQAAVFYDGDILIGGGTIV
ncbi:MAG: tRNA 2-thiouridine(34) synthase MnmA [Acutalibacteraceae bacterium]|nr:tRNA 2-thiouridine(34) synthase MnmA [Acutalibacteraceae bacterium]